MREGVSRTVALSKSIPQEMKKEAGSRKERTSEGADERGGKRIELEWEKLSSD